MNRIAAIAARHWKSLLALNLLVLAGTVAKVATSPPAWTATAQLILPDTSSNLDASLGTLGSFKDGELSFSNQVNPLNVQTSILTSDALLERVWNADPEKAEVGFGGFKQFFEAAPQEQSTTLSLTASGSSPELAQGRAIALIDAYQQRLNELRKTDRLSRQQFSQKELEQARARLKEAQTALAQFQQASGLVNTEAQTQGIVGTINTLTSTQAEAQAQAQASADRARVLSNRLSLTPEQAIRSLGLSENKDYQFVRGKLSEVNANLAQLQPKLGNQHPRMQVLLAERADLQRQLQGYVTQAAAGTQVDTTLGDNEGRANLIQQMVLAESDASSQQQQADQLQRRVEQLNTTLKSIPANQAQLLELQRQADVTEGVYKGLVAQVQQSNIDAFDTYPNVQVLDPPRVSREPSSPKLSLILLSALTASALGSVALVLLLEGRNPLLSPKDLQANRFPIVVRIPRLKHSGVGLNLGTETEVEFQRLASAISLQPLKDHRLLVTSAIMGEGKTTVALGLATALGDLGFRVLLVDGDFRQANLSRRLGVTQEPSAAEPIVRIQPGLDLIPTLPKQGKIVELVRRGQFEESITAAQSAHRYDYVLVDSAPVSLTSETALMAARIPTVLFVVRPGTSNRNSVNDALDQLAQHNAQLLGLVVNGVEVNSKPYTYRSNGALVNS